MKVNSTNGIFKLVALVVVLLGYMANAQVRKEVKIPDLPGYKTLKGDFHVHTVYSDLDVYGLILEYKKLGMMV